MEELIPFLVAIVWLVVSVVGRLARGRKGPQDDDAEADPTAVDQMLREMMHQAGLPQEEPTPGEHRTTASEHRPTASEHRPTPSETWLTSSEHRQTAAETRVTLSEHLPSASEHRFSPGEHLKGDVRLAPGRAFAPAEKSTRRGRSRFAQSLISDLRGARPLARAIVLREILGPPVSLQSSDELGSRRS